MREPRNPFRMRASEHIESDETFVRLFSPGVLEMLAEDLWSRPQIIRSAPGGGKSSLLRLFTPSSLRTVYSLRTREHICEVHAKLTELGAIDDTGPCLLGVLLSCGHSFAALEDLDVDEGRKRRLFTSLLNARIILAALRGVLELAHREYPRQLSDVNLTYESLPDLPMGLPLSRGDELHAWARDIEHAVCKALDSFLPLAESGLPGHATLASLMMLDPRRILVDGEPAAGRILLMLDDVHQLTVKQRRWLFDSIVTYRAPVAVWLAERLEALTVDELLSPGARAGRDYDKVIVIEEYWRGSRASRFERLTSSVADRRAQEAREVEITRFADCLQNSLDGDEWQERYAQALTSISDRVRRRTADYHRFSAWIAECDGRTGTPREMLLAWRTLEILTERELRKTQLAFDLELDTGELQRRDASDVRAAAELFVSREFDLPYYYGLSRLALLASSNIDQFLWLAGDLFEECASAALLRQPTYLTPNSQERILVKAIGRVWRELPQRVPYGTLVMRFLESIGNLSRAETMKPNAPYAPGVTGVAILMTDREKIRRSLLGSSEEEFLLLGQVIASCISHNLLEVHLNQKCKGQYWMVLYLNRMLCVHFGLPLQYGGWRERRGEDLANWIEGSPSPSPTQTSLFP